MRSITASIALLAVATTVFGADRLDPVVIVPPPRDGSPLLTRVTDGRPTVRTFTRNTGVRSFEVRASGVPAQGPQQYGIANDQGTLIAVRTREPLPVLLIDPFLTIDERTTDEIRRSFPYARRTDEITDDLRTARRQYLRDAGLIVRVRSFGHASADTQRPVRATAPRVLGPDEQIDIQPTRVIVEDVAEPVEAEAAQTNEQRNEQTSAEGQSPE